MTVVGLTTRDAYLYRTRTRSGLPSSSSTDYTLPWLCTKFPECAFSYTGPSTWNGQHEVLHALADPAEFRKQLKTHFFTAAHNVYLYYLRRGFCFYNCCNAPMCIFVTGALVMYRVGQKTDHFLKCTTFLYNDVGRHSIYQNVQLFTRSKNDILNAAVFKYSLHKVRETILH